MSLVTKDTKLNTNVQRGEALTKEVRDISEVSGGEISRFNLKSRDSTVGLTLAVKDADDKAKKFKKFKK